MVAFQELATISRRNFKDFYPSFQANKQKEVTYTDATQRQSLPTNSHRDNYLPSSQAPGPRPPRTNTRSAKIKANKLDQSRSVVRDPPPAAAPLPPTHPPLSCTSLN